MPGVHFQIIEIVVEDILGAFQAFEDARVEAAQVAKEVAEFGDPAIDRIGGDSWGLAPHNTQRASRTG